VSVVSVTHFLWAIFSIAFPYINVSLWNKNLTLGNGFWAVFRKAIFFCDSLDVKYHLQWNVSSIIKSNIPFIFMCVKCDLLHWLNIVFWGTVRGRLSGEYLTCRGG
jgi:hypothetical protein